ncbi:hypothetical protein JCM10449v2_006655 [Rhodotorula kratochvilovae]
MATAQKRLVILGATGETGRQALTAALADARTAQVLTFGRTAPTVDAATPGHSKLKHEPLDYEALLSERAAGAGGPETSRLRDANADAVLIAHGTTRGNAGSAERFERVDREYVLAAAEAARTEGKKQDLVYVSSGGANSKSWLLYPKSKGLTEEGLAGLGYARTTIFRPGLLIVPGGRGENRLPERLAVAVIPRLPFVASSLSILTPTLGRALVHAAVSPSPVGRAETFGGHEGFLVDNNAAQELGAASVAGAAQ